MTETINIDSQMEALKLQYINGLDAKFENISGQWAEVINSGLSTENFKGLLRLVHNMTGSSGLFGLSDLSDTARLLEDTLVEFIEETPRTEDADTKIRRMIDDLRKSVNI